jgi:hypothetical protein
MLDSVESGRLARSRLTGRLQDLVRALPDSVVLTSLRLDGDGSGALIAGAPHAVDVVARLDRSNALPGPRLDGRALAETIEGQSWEHFTILFGPVRKR